MPRSLDSGIYGADETSLASSIAGDALSVSGGGSLEDYWGSTEDDRAQALANVGKESLGPSDPKTPMLSRTDGGRGDIEPVFPSDRYPQMQRFPRHVRGVKTSSDSQNAETNSPPPRNQTATRKGGQPKP